MCVSQPAAAAAGPVILHFAADSSCIFHRLASVYSACKTEEFRKVTYLHIKNVLQKEPALKVTEVKELELRLLEGVQFHLNVYHPFNPAYAIIQDFLVRFEAPARPD